MTDDDVTTIRLKVSGLYVEVDVTAEEMYDLMTDLFEQDPPGLREAVEEMGEYVPIEDVPSPQDTAWRD